MLSHLGETAVVLCHISRIVLWRFLEIEVHSKATSNTGVKEVRTRPQWRLYPFTPQLLPWLPLAPSPAHHHSCHLHHSFCGLRHCCTSRSWCHFQEVHQLESRGGRRKKWWLARGS